MKQKLSLVAALAAALAFPVGAYGWGDGYGGTGTVPAPGKNVPGSSKAGGGAWPGSGKTEKTGTQGSNDQGGKSGGNWPGKQSGQSGGGWPGKQAGSGGKWPGGGPSYGGGRGPRGPIYGSAGRWEHRSGYGGYRPGRGRWEHRSGYGYPYNRGRVYPRRHDGRYWR
ncbi:MULTISPECIES: hypothetical protein [Methylosinus]|uniref:hypothetical protein n=1 Tax=Methylosinus TaxID=425 RepID=UPI0001D2DFBF|nr:MULTISPECIES: hypothetical protein [Methylosinus]